jgi:Protein-only RNase P
MVYIVPSGGNTTHSDTRYILLIEFDICVADDDWYWLYATVAENRLSYAVTNDLTRDHRLAFLESRMYLRWRNNHIIHFAIDRPLDIDANATILLTYPGEI